jgi:hypothetical protein
VLVVHASRACSAALACRALRQPRNRHRSPIELPVREPPRTGTRRSASLAMSRLALLDSGTHPRT